MLKKKLNRSIGGTIALFLLLALVGLYTSLPLFYTVSNAFKPLDQLYKFPPPLFVTNPTSDNFIELIQLCSEYRVPLSRYIVNSVFISVVATLGNLIMASMAAYPLAKHSFPGKKLAQKLVVMSLLFTSVVTYIPQYVVTAKMGLLDTQWSIILPMFMTPLGLYLMQNFIMLLNDSMLEAARIDGAGELRIYASIVMPNCKPAWLTLIIFSFQQVWNNTGNLYIYKESEKMLPSLLGSVAAGSSSVARAGVSAAASLLILIPPALIFLLSQSSVVETMSTSGMKD
jgi:ABC-type glycerol-3-phosphate transport system permease component